MPSAKPKTVKTRISDITFDVPQIRDGSFYPGALEKGPRSERALTMTLAEMYVQGVSTRKVKAITDCETCSAKALRNLSFFNPGEQGHGHAG
jgi:transposase-like protein